ncbi:MAG: hypothetical protein QOH31_1046 [Verrucomicrobiota bacterium]|jgi:hypothetical protein
MRVCVDELFGRTVLRHGTQVSDCMEPTRPHQPFRAALDQQPERARCDTNFVAETNGHFGLPCLALCLRLSGFSQIIASIRELSGVVVSRGWLSEFSLESALNFDEFSKHNLFHGGGAC